MPISRVCVLHIETLEMIPRCQNYKLKLIEAGYCPSLCNLNFQLNYCNINYVQVLFALNSLRWLQYHA